ncbi:MAG TPA: UDP-2,3-diacylglucosamine diphosphatase [Burkholderiaceae bacterium]|nr:UDP-2,3-diacylglucosamine diphosphatase [Burkholderiaceae bacterium]
MNSTPPKLVELIAPANWETVEFISDLHLSETQPKTFLAWQRYMESTTASAVFILGDLFEAWIGDDVVRSDISAQSTDINFEEQCALILQAVGQRLDLYVMHGNRDFLIGHRLMLLCNATLLSDPTVLLFQGQRTLLSHGDQLCLTDTQYLNYRQVVRRPEWIDEQLSKPIEVRRELARHMRLQSEQHHLIDGVAAHNSYQFDVDESAAAAWLIAAQAKTLIHGHTHRPQNHTALTHQKTNLLRIVLSDWDMDKPCKKAEILRWQNQEFKRIAWQ